MMAIDPNLVYEVPDVCEILRVGRNTVYNLFDSGQLKSFKLGSSRKIRGAAILAMIESAESAATPKQ